MKWQKLRPEPAIRSLLEEAVARLNERFQITTRLIRHPFGKLLAFHHGDFWIVHAGDGGRPSRFWTVGMVAGPEPRFLFPEQDSADFATCCNLLGVADEADRDAFRRFLFPQSRRPLATPVPGAP